MKDMPPGPVSKTEPGGMIFHYCVIGIFCRLFPLVWAAGGGKQRPFTANVCCRAFPAAAIPGLFCPLALLAFPSGRAIISNRFAVYRWASGIYARCRERDLYAGRMILPPVSASSIRWAHHPAMRETANSGV